MKLFLTHFIKDEKYFFPRTLRVLFFVFGKNGNELVISTHSSGLVMVFQKFSYAIKICVMIFVRSGTFLIYVLTFQTPSRRRFPAIFRAV